MDQVLQFAALGLSTGAVYAVLASSLVGVYAATGIINFAQGSIALWAVWQVAALRHDGTLVLPVGSVSLGEGALAAWPAVAIGVVAGVTWSLLAHLLVFRPLRRAPVLAQVVASIGLMLLLQGLVAIRFDTAAIAFTPALLPAGTVEVGGAVLARSDLLLAGLALVVAAALAAYFRFTPLGVATRAAAESERAARLTGLSPDRLAAVVWTLTGAASSLVVVLAAPSIGLDPTSFAFYVVPALSVALVGRLTSVMTAAVAGLVLGCLQTELFYLSTKAWWPDWAQAGVGDAVPFLVVVVALFVLGGRIPARGATGEVAMPEVVPPRIRPVTGSLFVGAVVVALLLSSATWRYGLISSIIMTLLALSLVLLTGYLGQISLATMAFAGTAGFVLSKAGASWGLPFPLDVVLAVAAATLAGVLVGIPALRIRGAQLAVVTLAAAIALQSFVFGNPALMPYEGHRIAEVEIFGLSLGIRHGTTLVTMRFALFALAVVTVLTVALVLVMRGATGRAFLAVRSNERAAASAGIDVAGTKLLGFALAALLAGVGGCLIGYSRGQLSVASFSVLTGLVLLALTYVGGVTSVGGAVVAGLVAPLGVVHTFLNDTLEVGEYYQVVAALLLVLTAVANPTGIAGSVRAAATHLRGARAGSPRETSAKEPAHVG
ncbi:ABC transporter permease [Nocardioides campestrisoli]|uniref:ABC transporter permease n=1 Tax=Nocardioides campestrisoli TaxID=2736757 RepID=UPI00163D5DFA|nr:ABC transporter permease [Nocardioides campestrisoli]